MSRKSTIFAALCVVSKRRLATLLIASIVNVDIGGKGHFKHLHSAGFNPFHTAESPSRLLFLRRRILTTASITPNQLSNHKIISCSFLPLLVHLPPESVCNSSIPPVLSPLPSPHSNQDCGSPLHVS
jgi:hypothetical protein